MPAPPADGSPSPAAPPRVALVIGSGAVKCAAAIGLRRVLDREGVDVDLVVGCSGGSLYAAALALGMSTDETEALTRQLWTRDLTRKRDTRSLLAAAFPKLFKFDGAFGMVDDRPLLDALRGAFGDRTFADTTTPLHIVATDFGTGERVVLSEGSLVDAVRASIAVPFVWKPWPVDGRPLCDGCLSDPMPADVAIQAGAGAILTMGFEAELPRRVSSGLKFAFQVTSVYTNNLYRANYAFHNLAHHAEILPVMPEFDERVGLFDTGKIPYVIERGEAAAEEVVPYLRRLLETEPAP
ncbi:patatin-like phospholipase family protein [Rubrivirga sp.]|uniref:patatin-like phospholipase family protein n=1 Tax=Rubrivirga sp. TaxID=1885344 RepID=UPI003B526A20